MDSLFQCDFNGLMSKHNLHNQVSGMKSSNLDLLMMHGSVAFSDGGPAKPVQVGRLAALQSGYYRHVSDVCRSRIKIV